MEPNELLKKVAALAKRDLTQKQIAEEIGFQNTTTLHSRLVKASQITGKPVPAFKSRGGRASVKRVETLQVKGRGKGDSFGVNVPGEPLARAGFKVGTKLSVKASRG